MNFYFNDLETQAIPFETLDYMLWFENNPQINFYYLFLFAIRTLVFTLIN